MTHQELLIQRVKEYFDSQNWNYTNNEKAPHLFELNIRINAKLNQCKAIVLVDEKVIETVVLCSLKASPPEYANVVEYITRANFGPKLGRFEFNYANGEIRFHNCLLCQETIPCLKDVERSIDVGFVMFQLYGDGLVKNIMGFGNPEEDIKAIKK